MIRAYDEIYLPDARQALGDCFDYAINVCGLDANWVSTLLMRSRLGEEFEAGNPSVLAGMSGVELARGILGEVYPGKVFPPAESYFDRTPEFWAGWALAHYQWQTPRSFERIFQSVPFSEMVEMYPLYHEMDQSQFVDAIDALMEERQGETRLKIIREARGLSQTELAEKAEVGIRSIQMYEQRVNDIDKAQGRTLYKLARVLGCRMEDLLEKPYS